MNEKEITKFKVNIGTFDDVKEFVDVCTKYDFPIDYINGRYIINAKSQLGILSTHFEEDAEIFAHSTDKVTTDKLYEELHKWTV